MDVSQPDVPCCNLPVSKLQLQSAFRQFTLLLLL